MAGRPEGSGWLERRDSRARAGGQAGFTLVELLVACAVFVLMYAGVHGLFTSTWMAWRRASDRTAPYEKGLALVDSIVRDARPAKNATGTTATLVAGNYGNNLTLVLNYPARLNAAGRWNQKRVTYQNTASGFKRWVETSETATATADITSGINRVTREWTLSRMVTDFQFERWDYFAGGTAHAKRVIRFFLTLRNGQTGGYKLNGRVYLRRSAANADVPDYVTY